MTPATSGADKLVVNTAIADDPALVSRLAQRYGRQCIVASMDVKRNASGSPQIVVDRGSRVIDSGPQAWARNAVELGAGEILFNSVDHDGARKGYDLESIREVCGAVSVPVIAFGGVFTWNHLVEGINAGAAAVAVANLFHYTEQSTRKAKTYLADAGVLVGDHPEPERGRFHVPGFPDWAAQRFAASSPDVLRCCGHSLV